jgi:hypothetical protein
VTEATRPTFFSLYMQKKSFSIQSVASTSHVPLSTLWRMLHDLPITANHAQRVRQGLFHLTGVWYSAHIVTLEVGEDAISLHRTTPRKSSKLERF